MLSGKQVKRVQLRKSLVKCEYCQEKAPKSTMYRYRSLRRHYVYIHYHCARSVGLFDEYSCSHCRDGGCPTCRPSWFL